MATFDRFDICAAHQALENDWNVDGWIRERPSNLRRMESTGVQLHRIRYQPGQGAGGCFEGLESDNEREIYCEALASFGMSKYLSRDDETHADIVKFIVDGYVPEYVCDHFPTLINHG